MSFQGPPTGGAHDVPAAVICHRLTRGDPDDLPSPRAEREAHADLLRAAARARTRSGYRGRDREHKGDPRHDAERVATK